MCNTAMLIFEVEVGHESLTFHVKNPILVVFPNSFSDLELGNTALLSFKLVIIMTALLFLLPAAYCAPNLVLYRLPFVA